MKLEVKNQQIKILEALPFVSNTENVYEVEYVFGEEWEGWQKTAVFEGCGASYQVVLTASNKCNVPNAILAQSGYVRFGVLGTKAEGDITRRYPTVWSEEKWVEVASIGVGTPAPPTPEVYAQILANEAALEADVTALESGKVDKVAGKGLSTYDYDLTEKTKVSDSYAAKHTHDNLNLLNSLTLLLTQHWTDAWNWVSTNGANVLSHLADTVAHVTATDKSNWNSKSSVSVSGTGTATETVKYITVNGVEKKLAGSGGGGGVDFLTVVNGKICVVYEENTPPVLTAMQNADTESEDTEQTEQADETEQTEQPTSADAEIEAVGDPNADETENTEVSGNERSNKAHST